MNAENCAPARRRSGTASTLSIWLAAVAVPEERARGLAFVLISRLYRQMYADTGSRPIARASARSALWARWLARFARRLFVSEPMPALREPRRAPSSTGKRIPVVTVS